MKFLIPPVLFAILVVSLGALFAFHPAGMEPIHPRGLPIGEVLLALGFGLMLLVGARIQFARNEAEIMTIATPRNLVTDGLFRYSRNPMYLGFLFVLLASALAVNMWCALAAPLLFALALRFWYVPFEERAALQAFGEDYKAYRERTRRWL